VPHQNQPAHGQDRAAAAQILADDRYSAVLFIEKEGFNALLARARIAERFDIAIMSTTAARHLLDRLAPRIDKVLVAHDFDVSGFSIFGTLGSDGRRYRFHNDVHVVDLGLPLSDVEALGLDSVPVETSGGWSARAATLAAHGASAASFATAASNSTPCPLMYSSGSSSASWQDMVSARLYETRMCWSGTRGRS
jgi:hypothetical protein